jgi:hypothetical protein
VHTKMGRKIKTANIIKNHIYRNFVKEMWMWNLWNFPAKPQGSTEHSLNTSALNQMMRLWE